MTMPITTDGTTTAGLVTPTTARPIGSRRRRRRGTVIPLLGMELRLIRREPMMFVGLVIFPVITMVILQGVFGSIPDPEFGGMAPTDFYLASYVGIVLAAMGLMILPVHLAGHRESGVLRRFQATGVSPAQTVLAEAALALVLSIAAAALIVVTGALAYGVKAPENPAGVVGWFVVGACCFAAIGGALGLLAPTARSDQAIGTMVYLPAFLLGGGGPPRAVMTGPMQAIGDVLPLTHITSGLQQAWLGRANGLSNVWWPLLATAIAMLIMVLAVRRREA